MLFVYQWKLSNFEKQHNCVAAVSTQQLIAHTESQRKTCAIIHTNYIKGHFAHWTSFATYWTCLLLKSPRFVNISINMQHTTHTHNTTTSWHVPYTRFSLDQVLVDSLNQLGTSKLRKYPTLGTSVIKLNFHSISECLGLK